MKCSKPHCCWMSATKLGGQARGPWPNRGHLSLQAPPEEDKAGLTWVWERVACEWLLFNLYLVPRWSQSWDQSRKWKHMARVSRIRGPPHTRWREGKRQWELVWRNGLNKQSLQSPAPYYPIIYTAWELGNAGDHWFPLKKWHSTPHANQRARHYSPRQVLNSFRPNVFILNIPGKLLHQRQEMSCHLKFPAAKHTFNYIITLEIVFVQSIARIKCGSMRLG